MVKEWLTTQGLTMGPGFALLLFLAVFLGVLFWIFRPGSAKRYAENANLPLDDALVRNSGGATQQTQTR